MGRRRRRTEKVLYIRGLRRTELHSEHHVRTAQWHHVRTAQWDTMIELHSGAPC